MTTTDAGTAAEADADADADAGAAADAEAATDADAEAAADADADADVVTTADADADADAATEDATIAGPKKGAATKAGATKAGPAKKAPPTKKVSANKGGRNSEPAALTKPEKRALAKQLAAKRAAAQRRRRVGGYLITFILIGGIIAAVFIGLNWKTKKDTPAPKPSAAAFPVLPDGADPALKTKPDVKAGTGTPSKLVVTPIVEGKGPATTNGQTLTVNYVGVKYATGEEFDSSWSRSQTLDFQLGGQVIQGWNQGLLNVKVGSRLQLDIPASLAYGDKDDGSGRPFGPLRFVVDVLAAK